MDPLKIAAWSRWVPGIAYLLAVAIVGLLIFLRSLPPPAVATQHFERNHQLAAGDLETSTTTALIGRYLQKEVQKSDVVTTSMVGQKQVPAPFTAGMAVLVSAPTLTLTAQKIQPGSDVNLCLKTNLLAGPIKVLKVEDCDQQVCWVLVQLTKAAAKSLDPDVLGDVRMFPAAQTCSGAP